MRGHVINVTIFERRRSTAMASSSTCKDDDRHQWSYNRASTRGHRGRGLGMAVVRSELSETQLLYCKDLSKGHNHDHMCQATHYFSWAGSNCEKEAYKSCLSQTVVSRGRQLMGYINGRRKGAYLVYTLLVFFNMLLLTRQPNKHAM